jgi:hypothetical protein
LSALLLLHWVQVGLFVYFFLENPNHRSRKGCMIFKSLFKLHFWRGIKVFQVWDKSFYLLLASALNLWYLLFDARLMKYIFFI